jgi:hypothetical protein
MHTDDAGAQRATIDRAVRQLLAARRATSTVIDGCSSTLSRCPAIWLERRALTCAAARYHTLIAERLADISVHGDSARYGAYFPSYFLKCLQDWFQHHGEELYDELEHIRNALDQVLASARFAAGVQRDAQHTELLAATHRLIQARRAQREKSDGRQLPLF